MCANHMIGASSRKKVTSVTTPATKRMPPPKLRRSVGRSSTSMTVAIFGANHIKSTRPNRRSPAPGRMKSWPAPANATAIEPNTSSPIQPGEPRNISSAKASW